MRRLATQSRGESVASRRDYQEISVLGSPARLLPASGGPASVTIRYDADEGAGSMAGVGGYFSAEASTRFRMRVMAGDADASVDREVVVREQNHWTRAGIAWSLPDGGPAWWAVEISWTSGTPLVVWGLNCGALELPEPILRRLSDEPDVLKALNTVSVAPEAYYLSHDRPLCGGVVVGLRNASVEEDRREAVGKKCSQCQRFLPIDPRLADYRALHAGNQRAPRNMVIAFHGHRDKRTGYQNECRACKNRGINGHFNGIRTPDQFHESSTLNRERRLLLCESEILAQFKERHRKEGLRSFIWRHFGGRCFRCGSEVSVRDYQLDHTRPLAYLWPLDEHATCLCSDCNNTKKDSFPIDFYSPEELTRLAAVVGLSYDELSRKSFNQVELRRILADLLGFANSWDARLFNSVADRVLELHPEIDLFEELERLSPGRHDEIVQELRSRPASVLGNGPADDDLPARG